MVFFYECHLMAQAQYSFLLNLEKAAYQKSPFAWVCFKADHLKNNRIQYDKRHIDKMRLSIGKGLDLGNQSLNYI